MKKGCFAELTFADGMVIYGNVNVSSLQPSGRGWIGKFNCKDPFNHETVSQRAILRLGQYTEAVHVAWIGNEDIFMLESAGSKN